MWFAIVICECFFRFLLQRRPEIVWANVFSFQCLCDTALDTSIQNVKTTLRFRDISLPIFRTVTIRTQQNFVYNIFRGSLCYLLLNALLFEIFTAFEINDIKCWRRVVTVRNAPCQISWTCSEPEISYVEHSLWKRWDYCDSSHIGDILALGLVLVSERSEQAGIIQLYDRV